MDLKYLIRLDREHINLIRNICLKENSFQSASTLFYEGQTPIVAYLRKFHNLTRCTMVPTQALRAELPAGTKLDEDGWADVGDGVLDWRGQLAPAALANGARWLVAEHDKPSDPARFARRSFAFLNSL